MGSWLRRQGRASTKRPEIFCGDLCGAQLWPHLALVPPGLDQCVGRCMAMTVWASLTEEESDRSTWIKAETTKS